MPKQILKLDLFHGGINDDADPRDIADNQFADISAMDVSHVGRITVLGQVATTHQAMTGAITTPGGRGFIAIKTDYDGFATGTADAGGRTYYVIENGAAVNIEDAAASPTESETAISVANLEEASMYYAGGALRIYDADHATTVTPQWRGFIKASTYMTGASGGDVDIAASWYTGAAQILGAFPEFAYNNTQVCKNALMLDVVSDASGEQSYSFDADSNTTTFDTDYDGTTLKGTSDHNWGLAVEYGSDGNGTGTWMKSTSTRYKFFVTTMYDEHTQESLPQLLRMWSIASVQEFVDSTCDLTDDPTITHDDDDGKIRQGMTVSGDGIPANSYVKSVTTDLEFELGDTAGGGGNDVPTTGGTASNVALTFNSGGGSYSNTEITTELAITDTESETASIGRNVNLYLNTIFKVIGTAYNFGSPNGETDEDDGNKRISGCRVYWTSNEDGYTDLWMLFDAKFDEGCKVIGVDGGGTGSSLGYSPWTNHNYGEHVKVDISSANKWTDPPKYVSYQHLNTHSHTEPITVDSFKASVYANRRMYIGHYEQDGKIRGDSMLKSPVGQLDKFPKDLGRIDVAVDDGDEIVALMEYADRLLQFKKSSLYILNISGEYDALESEHRFKGISNPGAVCKTDYGIAWANQNGCYLYDGKQVRDLLEDKGMRKISNTAWSTHIDTAKYERVGYNPKRRQIIVTDGRATDAHAYVFDIVTGSWTRSTNMIGDTNTGSPFVNDPETGTLLLFDDDDNEIDKWDDDSIQSSNNYIIMETKDLDFGHPGVRKKIYKVYISYKGDGSNTTVRYTINGETSGTPGNFYKITSATDGSSSGATNSNTPLWSGTVGTSDWLTAELKPVSSINNVNSFRLLFGGRCADNFEINDISIVYRLKNIK